MPLIMTVLRNFTETFCKVWFRLGLRCGLLLSIIPASVSLSCTWWRHTASLCKNRWTDRVFVFEDFRPKEHCIWDWGPYPHTARVRGGGKFRELCTADRIAILFMLETLRDSIAPTAWGGRIRRGLRQITLATYSSVESLCLKVSCDDWRIRVEILRTVLCWLPS